MWREQGESEMDEDGKEALQGGSQVDLQRAANEAANAEVTSYAHTKLINDWKRNLQEHYELALFHAEK